MAGESQQDKVRRNLVPSGYLSSASDISSVNLVYHHHHHQMQSFESNPAQVFNLTTGMEMLAFPSKTDTNNHRSTDVSADPNSMWKEFFNKQPTTTTTNPSIGSFSSSSSSSKQNIITSTTDTTSYPNLSTSSGLISETTTTSENLILRSISDHHQHNSSWQDHNMNDNNKLIVDDDSNIRCLYPNSEKPSGGSQGLSLSLSSNRNNNNIIGGIHSFDQAMRETKNQQDGFFGRSASGYFPQQQIMQDGFHVRNSVNDQTCYQQTNNIQLKNSKYLVPAQELLYELCNLGTKQNDDTQQVVQKQKMNRSEDEDGSTESSRKQSFLYSLDLLELEKRKTKLISMLEEVDRKYRQYCDQMKGAVSSFEAVLGGGAASAYSSLASKAMSKHFRCLRDGIVDQIKAIKKAMGEKDPVAPGTTKGETPRLRLLDQTLRQQRAFQQMTMMESHPWRPQRGLPERSVSVLRAWLFEHFLHPYPSDVDKHILARQTGLSRSQVSNWFINARVRLWKPMVEEMYVEETKEQDNVSSSSDWITGISLDDNSRLNSNPHRNPQVCSEDRKPTHDQLIRGDSETLSSIINMPDKINQRIENGTNTHSHYHNYQQQEQLQQQRRMQLAAAGRVSNENFDIGDLDFSSYSNDGVNQQNNLGTGVSLTLGLQQHGGSGINLSFSPAAQQPLFYPREHIGGVDEQVQYSILDGEQNLPYRNLMGSQLLHDFAG
ncbi:hypothetical protein MKX03_037377 [Papaver bracteatum]|nr:hypothetical protein MKX03_037377 [Papaver bracteatum]